MFGNGYMFVGQGETSDNSDAQNLRKVVWWLWVTWPKAATVTGVIVHRVLPAEQESGKSWVKCWAPRAELASGRAPAPSRNQEKGAHSESWKAIQLFIVPFFLQT